MMTSTRSICLLLALNGALALTVFHFWSGRRTSLPGEAGVPDEPLARGSAKEGESGQSSVKRTWADLRSSDLRRYIANLREVHCPEPTIQDIISAEVHRIYTEKEEKEGLARHRLRPWEFAETSNSRNIGRIQRLRVLRIERQSLLRELLGVEIPVEMPEIVSSSGHSLFEAALSFLPEEKRASVRVVQNSYWDLAESLSQETDGIYLPKDLAQYRAIRDDRMKALRAVLTPKEIEDLELRVSTTGRRLAGRLPGFDATEDEYRKIFQVQRDLHEKYSSPGQLAGDHSEFRNAETQAAAQQDQLLMDALGKDRFQDYQRSQDSNWRSISQVTQGVGASKEASLQAYVLHQSVQQSMNSIMQNTELTPQARSEQLAQLRKSSLAQLQGWFGDKGMQQIASRLPAFRNLQPRSDRTRREEFVPVEITPVNP